MGQDILDDAIAEAVALFRLQVLGGSARRELAPGELRAGRVALSQKEFVLPSSDSWQRFGVSTAERWYHALRRFGMAGSTPRVRSDKRLARVLAVKQEKHVFAIRCEYPLTSARLILKTLERPGNIDTNIISPTTLRHYFRQKGDRKGLPSICTGRRGCAGRQNAPPRCITPMCVMAPKYASSNGLCRCGFAPCWTMPRAISWPFGQAARKRVGHAVAYSAGLTAPGAQAICSIETMAPRIAARCCSRPVHA